MPVRLLPLLEVANATIPLAKMCTLSASSARSRSGPSIMFTANEAYGDLIRLSLSGDGDEETLTRIPLGTPSAQGGIDEPTLQDLLFRYPQTLPIASIDAAYDAAVPVCRELSTPAGYVDALGRLTLAEFKLWRNPQARREVIGQILDYAKEIASWSYEDLQREVSKSLKRPGNVLFDLVRATDPSVDEGVFVDNVTRHLRRGEFLLLIVGDGIREGVENIVDFVQKHSGLHFNLALVEAALYRDTDEHVIVQPRVLCRTEIVRRVVFEAGETRDILPDDPEGEDVLSDLQRENLRFWTAVLENLAFSDATVDIPDVTKESTLYVKVRNSGFGDWGLSFVGYLYRGSPHIGCYLTCRKDIPQAVRVYEQVEATLEKLRQRLGDDLQTWKNSNGRPRIGYRRRDGLPFGAADSSPDFQESVRWMREKLDVLVSNVYPRLQVLLSGSA